jgi:hypothetical protein
MAISFNCPQASYRADEIQLVSNFRELAWFRMVMSFVIVIDAPDPNPEAPKKVRTLRVTFHIVHYAQPNCLILGKMSFYNCESICERKGKRKPTVISVEMKCQELIFSTRRFYSSPEDYSPGICKSMLGITA